MSSRAKVAIVVPNYKESLTPGEEQSLQRLLEFYGGRPLYALVPEHAPGAGRPFPSSFEHVTFSFRTLLEYSALLVDPVFYRRFEDFDYILIHQLDAYVLSDQLDHWCARGFDFVGAPIFEGWEPADPRGKMRWVGNGGFSLRNVASALKVLRSRRRFRTFRQGLALSRAKGVTGLRAWRENISKLTRHDNGVKASARVAYHEDIFWATDSRHFYPKFRLPSIEEALEFAFEYAPRHCYELNRNRLPFGCHKWEKFDPEFWREFIPPPARSS